MASPPYSIGPLTRDDVSGLSYRLRLPLPAAPTALVILLHGVGSNETDLAELVGPIAADAVVALGRGPLALGPSQFAWFHVNFTSSGPVIEAGEAETSRHALTALVQNLQALYSIAAAKTVIAGFSQGGIMSAGVGLSAPERVAGFGVLSGRILPELAPHIAAAGRLAHLRAFVAHGEHDGVLPISWAHRSDQWLSELGVEHVLRLYPIAHTISPAEHAEFVAWLDDLLKP